MKIFERNIPRLRLLLFSFEFCLMLGILYLISFLQFIYVNGVSEYWLFNSYTCLGKCLLFVVVCQGCMYLNELYDYTITRKRREFTIRLLQSLGIACILLSILYLSFESLSLGQLAFLLALPTLILSIFLWRELYPTLLRLETLAERVMILGSARIGRDILREIAELRDSGYEVVALAEETDYENHGNHPPNPVHVENVFPMEKFPEKVGSLNLDRIVVALGDRRGKLPFRTLLNCRFKGIQVDEAASFYESLKGKILMEDVRPSWFIFSEGFRKSRFVLRMKRISDLIMAAALLVLASPVMAVTALLIKIDSRGAAIYRQDRVGESWKDYTLYKFRSMVQNAEAQGAQWAEKDDPRVTRVGRVIRKYRIDELPQLFNVLRGDMSFVGPRPERRTFVLELAKEIPYYPQRLFVKPGVTGWAQVKFHYGATKEDSTTKLQYDLYYIKHMSLFFDMSIIFDTIRVVLSGAGAR